MRAARGACVLALLVLLSPQVAAALLPTPPPATLPPESDAFVVAGAYAMESRTLRLAGDFVVLPGARLTLTNVTIVFDATEERHPAFRVAAGAIVDAVGLTLTNDAAGSPEERAASWFDVDVHGRLRMRDCVVEHARVIMFTGPDSTMNLVDGCIVRYAAAAGVSFTRGANGTVRGSHVHMNFQVASASVTGGGVHVGDSRGVLVEGNIFEDIVGSAIVSIQSTTVGSYAFRTAATVRGNLVYDSSPARHASGVGAFAVYVDGGTPEALVEDNAVAASYVGIGAAYGAGVTVRGNDVVGVAVAGGVDDEGRVGLRANGTRVMGREDYSPLFEGNRVRGFTTAAQATSDGYPAFRGNALGPTNGFALDASAALNLVDARANWWGADGAAGHVSGPVVADGPLAADPWSARAFDVTAVLDGGELVVTFANRGDVSLDLDAHLRNARADAWATRVTVPPGGLVVRVPLDDAPAAGTHAVVLARTAEGATAVAAARAA